MARPTKQGVDYFPLDVHLDNKFKFVEIKYGIEGFGIVVKILQNIYSQGYWTQWGEDEQLLFAGEHRVDFEKLKDVTEECLKRGVFNADLFKKHEILTSNGIQKRYKEIVRRRKEVAVIDEYLLIDSISLVNDVNNSQNVGNVPTSSKQDDCESTQSKVKETKEKKSKENNKKTSRHKQVYDEESLEMKISLFFYERILENNPDHKKPNFQTWADDVRKMLELDKRHKDEIGVLMRWVQKDDFEMSNVLSPAKLRARYDALIMKMKAPKKATGKIQKTNEPEYNSKSVDASEYMKLLGEDY